MKYRVLIHIDRGQYGGVLPCFAAADMAGEPWAASGHTNAWALNTFEEAEAWRQRVVAKMGPLTWTEIVVSRD